MNPYFSAIIFTNDFGESLLPLSLSNLTHYYNYSKFLLKIPLETHWSVIPGGSLLTLFINQASQLIFETSS